MIEFMKNTNHIHNMVSGAGDIEKKEVYIYDLVPKEVEGKYKSMYCPICGDPIMSVEGWEGRMEIYLDLLKRSNK